MKSDSRISVLLLAIILFLSFSGLNNRDLWTPDEPRVAEIAREMAETGNFVVPKLNRSPFLEQPPLFYATVASVFMIAKRATDGLARIPPAFFGLIGILATYLIASSLFGKKVGILSAFVLATSFEYLRVSHWVIVDSALSAFIYLALWSFVKAYFGEEKDKSFYYSLFHIFSVLAFFVKGFIGIGVPAISVLTFLFTERNLREIKNMRLLLGAGIFFLATGFWTFGLYRQGGFDHLATFYIDNNLMRFLPGGKSGHHHPFYFYLREFPAGFLPWFFLLVPAFFYIFSKRLTHDEKGIRFLKCYFISGFVLFSLAATKRILYLLPIFAPASIIVATYLDHLTVWRKFKTLDRVFLWIYALLYFFLGLLIIPLLLHMARKYGVRVEGDLLPPLVASSSLIILSLFSIFSLSKERMEGFLIFSSLSLFVFFSFILLWVCPYVNPYKSFKPFVERVLKEVPKGAPIHSYKPDETIRGFFPFYSGIYLNEVKERGDLSSLSKEKGVYVVIRDKDGSLSLELKEEGFVEVFRIQRDSRRSLCLFKSK